ncbi:translation elongation factor Ts [Clostridiaceae bacterium HSG29]|nr:translation elongation factor Ts [Clostridiaceae bacterium HSG29]
MSMAKKIKELRELTSAGMLDCKKAITEADGNLEKAQEILREKGLASAAKKAGRVATEGIVVSYIHGSRIGAIVEINSETDFVSKNDGFKAFAKDIAMQVAAANPKYVSREEVPAEVVAAEKEFLKNQALGEGKPEHIVDKMIEGRINKYFGQICLLEQAFIKDGDMTINDLLQSTIARIGENLSIRRFSRFEVGEGLEKKVENFAEEVASQL